MDLDIIHAWFYHVCVYEFCRILYVADYDEEVEERNEGALGATNRMFELHNVLTWNS